MLILSVGKNVTEITESVAIISRKALSAKERLNSILFYTRTLIITITSEQK